MKDKGFSTWKKEESIEVTSGSIIFYFFIASKYKANNLFWSFSIFYSGIFLMLFF